MDPVWFSTVALVRFLLGRMVGMAMRWMLGGCFGEFPNTSRYSQDKITVYCCCTFTQWCLTLRTTRCLIIYLLFKHGSRGKRLICSRLQDLIYVVWHLNRGFYQTILYQICFSDNDWTVNFVLCKPKPIRHKGWMNKTSLFLKDPKHNKRSDGLRTIK